MTDLNPITDAGVIAVQLERHDDSNILLGYRFATADLEDGTQVEIIGSGNTLAFRVKLAEDERTREWRCRVNEIAGLAVALARKEQAELTSAAS